jgi:hypothetical protein
MLAYRQQPHDGASPFLARTKSCSTSQKSPSNP